MSTNWPNTFPYQIVFESKTFSSPFRFMFVELKQKQKNDLRAKSLHFKHNPIQINERIQFIPLKIVIYFCVRLCWSLINERLNELILFPWPRPLRRWRLTRGHARLAGLLATPHQIYGDQAEIMGGNQKHSQHQTSSVKALGTSWGLDCHCVIDCHGLPIVLDVSWSNYNLTTDGQSFWAASWQLKHFGAILAAVTALSYKVNTWLEQTFGWVIFRK